MKALPKLTDEQCDRIEALINEQASVDRAVKSAMDAASIRHAALADAFKSWWDEVLGDPRKAPNCAYSPRDRALTKRVAERAYFYERKS